MGQDDKRDNKPVTYGDVFTAAADGPIASEPITTEDASLMQTVEAMAFGRTTKGGPASTMQSVAAKNVQDGLVKRDAHSAVVAEHGVSVKEASAPGAVMDVVFVAGEAVSEIARPTPVDPAIASLDAVTVGEALEAAAVNAGERPINAADARAILSAERRATGISMPVKGGIGATAQSAAQLNSKVPAGEGGNATLAGILKDATSILQADKVVTHEDALKVLKAELRGRNAQDLQPGGLGATLLAAADLNEQSGLFPPPSKYNGQSITENDLLFIGATKHAIVTEQLGKYEPLNSPSDSKQNDVEEKSVTRPEESGNHQAKRPRRDISP